MKLILLIVIITIVVVYLRKNKRRPAQSTGIPAPGADDLQTLLETHIDFYNRLLPEDKPLFLKRVQHFLDRTRITPVGNVELRPQDRVYVAASAIIPIFAFTDWAYNNLDEVLIYPGAFAPDFDRDAAHKNAGGMVGDGAMHRMMILSLPALRAGFEQNQAGNTGIHEFVHLLDKADGATDGVPGYMIPKELVAPWIEQMHKAISGIRNDDSDLNPYAGTNEAEFFAVLSEYFFQKPAFLAAHHPELFRILEKTYRSPDYQSGK